MKQLAICFALIAGTVLAQGPRGGGFGPPMGPGGQGMMAERLDAATFDALKTYLSLTDAQVTSLKAALRTRAEANKPIRDQIQAKQTQLQTEMAKDNPSATVVGTLMVEMKKLRDSLKDQANGPFTDALAVLTPAQQTKLKELEAAQKLVQPVHQAEALGLLARPEPPAGLARGMAANRARQLMRAQGMRRAMRNQI